MQCPHPGAPLGRKGKVKKKTFTHGESSLG
jgi:hypothetical protein